MQLTSIEWTDISTNPIRARRLDGGQRVPGHFCQKISPGCANCYASRFQQRFRMPQFPGTSKSPADMGVEPFLDERVLQSLLKRRKPGKVFWCDQTDLFGDWVPFDWIDKCFAVMALTPHLTHQVLTKRPARMAEYQQTRTAMDDSHRVDTLPQWYQVYTRWFDDCYGGGRFFEHERDWDRAYAAAEIVNPTQTISNIWHGTSIEDQQRADERIPELLKCPAAVRFLSVEPLLEPVDLHDAFYRPRIGPTDPYKRLFSVRAVNWVIVGCESKGQYAGRFAEGYEDAAHDLIDQCRAASVPFFHKQMPINGKVSHDPSEWPEWARVRQMPAGQE